MLKLVIKDFRANTMYLLLLLVVIAGISVGFNFSIISELDIETELYVVAVILSTTVASKVFAISDNESNADLFFAGLPVNRKQMVIAKYISSAMLVLITLGVHYLAILLSSNETLRMEHAFMYQPPIWILTFLLLTFSDAFSFPFFVRFGLAKGAMAYGTFLLTLMIVTVLTINMLNPSDLLYEWFIILTNQHPIALISELAIFGCLILGSSMIISINAFKHKDL
ncbi:ABC-2 transporter permease [Ekhidna sp.]|uniref:ABC-2 transporter permease n=1 Tax=Ekhidna sp. TaxID=2608089 RepID=UPI0032985C21